MVLAFGLGYGVRRLLDDEEGDRAVPVGVTFRQAASVRLGTTPEQLLRRFAGRPHAVGATASATCRCFVYLVSDRPETAWSFCFRNNRLHSSATSPG